jgi:hypothetical protein
MDFVEGFPKAGGKSVILTVVDRFSKYAHFIHLGHPYSATTVAKAFFDQVVRLHGIPLFIVSDRDPVFTSSVWRELFRLFGTQLRMSSAFQPQTDGQSKVTNKVITMYLHCLAGDRPKTWLQWLPWAEYCYNTSYQTALRTTPFHVVYGRAPPPMIPYQLGATRVTATNQQLRNRDVFLQEVRDRLLQAQSVMKAAHDKQHRYLEFMVDDWVWLRLNQRATSSVCDAPPSKLASKYFRPYEVIQRIGQVAYKLQLPPKARIHDVFHVAFLKKFEGTPPSSVPPLPALVRGRVVPTPEAVVHARPTQDSWEVLVRWQDRPTSKATWETIEHFKEAYPEFQLVDELFQQQGEVLWTNSMVSNIQGRIRRQIVGPAVAN